MYATKQVGKIRDITTTCTDYDTDLFKVLKVYDEFVPMRDEITGDILQDDDGNDKYYEVPLFVKQYRPVIRKITLDVSDDCFLVINNEYYAPIHLRSGINAIDYTDIDVTSLRILKKAPASNDIELYAMVSI